MVPQRAPAGTTASEIEVFELIRGAANSEDYVCLHSLGIAQHMRKEYAETDFVLIGPPGVFCLEVKGGNVQRKAGTWEIGWPGKTYTSVEGPFKQAQSSRWALIEYLSQRLKLNIRHQFIFGWGVIFPNIIFNWEDPEWDNRVVYDQRDKQASFVCYAERLEHYFRERLEETDRTQPPRLRSNRIHEIVGYLRKDFDVVQSLKGLLAESERELITLSSEQYRVLDLALNDDNPRILCIGGAGAGKTLIAMEAARRLARSGKRILLLCFNNNLDRFLRLDAAEAGQNITISTVHLFFAEIIRKGGFGSQLAGAREAVSSDQFFSQVYPNLFESAAAALIEENQFPQFDGIIIDEAQDVLETSIFNCLDLVLHNGFSSGRWLICLDNGLQAGVYGRMNEDVLAQLKSFGATTVLLSENYRNPKNIVAEMCVLTGAFKPTCKRELQSPVDYRVYTNEKEQGKKLRALLIELLHDGVQPNLITVLSSKNKVDACITRYPPDVGKPIYFLDFESGKCPNDAITAGTVSGFKGLENEFIILTDLPATAQLSDWARSVLYVGMTRARTKLYVLVDNTFLQVRSKI
jgi:Nuclease-related domain/UvrD-like helicase C-terminal domain/AAA domain